LRLFLDITIDEHFLARIFQAKLDEESDEQEDKRQADMDVSQAPPPIPIVMQEQPQYDIKDMQIIAGDTNLDELEKCCVDEPD
jgi:hypothetical protein